MKKFAQYILDRPKKLILLCILAIGFLIPGIFKLEGQFDHKIWFREDDTYLLEFKDFERKFGNDDAVIFIMSHPDGIFTKERLQTIREITEDFWQIPEIIRVDSLSNYNWVHAEVVDGEEELVVEPLIPEDLDNDIIQKRKNIALSLPTLKNYLVSSDSTTAVIYARLKPVFSEKPKHQQVVTATEELRKKFQDRTDLTLQIGGVPALTVAFKQTTVKDLKKILPLLLIGIVFVFYLIFGFNKTIIYPFLIIVLSSVCTFGAAGHLGIGFNVMTSMIPSILVAISLADTIHVLTSYFYYQKEEEPEGALYHALEHNLKPTLMTSITTSIGFFSLLTTSLVPIKEFGILAGIGALVTWCLTIFLMVPLMKLMPVKMKVKEKKSILTFQLGGTVGWLNKFKWPITFVFLGATIFLAYMGTQNEINSTTLDYFDKNDPVKKAHVYLGQKIGGGKSIQLVIDSGSENGLKDPAFLNKVEKFQNWMSGLPKITKVSSLLGVIKEVNKALNNDDPDQYVIPQSREMISQELLLYSMGLPPGMDLNYWNTLDNRILRLNVMWEVDGSKKVYKTIKMIEDKADEMNLNARVAGKMQLIAGLDKYIINTFFSSMQMALLVVTILMIVILKSLKLGLLSMIPNVVPPLMGLGLMTLTGRTIDVGTILIFSVCLGIAVDDTIFFLNDYRERELQGKSVRDTLVDVLNHSGKALVFTTMLLVVGFGCFSFGSFIPNKNFGIMTAIVLFLALVTDLILLPAIMMILPGKKQ